MAPYFKSYEGPFNGYLVLFLFDPNRTYTAYRREIFSVFVCEFSLYRSMAINFLPANFTTFRLRVSKAISYVIIRGRLVLLDVPLPKNVSVDSNIFRRESSVERGRELHRRILNDTRRA